MKINQKKYSIKKKVDEVIFIKHKVFFDSRGEFKEIYKFDEFDFLNKNFKIKQINLSKSKKNVIRGLHLQLKPNLSKIMRVVKGSAILFSFDCRNKNKKNKIISYKSHEDDNLLIYAPYYYARGFLSLENNTIIEYFCNNTYNPKSEYSVNFFDDNIQHSFKNKKKYIISKKDLNANTISEFKKLKLLNNL